MSPVVKSPRDTVKIPMFVPPSAATGSVAKMVTAGRPGGRTIIVMGSELLVAPRLSVATACNTYSPAAGGDHHMQNGLTGLALDGLLVVIPMLFVPTKNSTVATKSSTSWASAQMPIVTGKLQVE